MNVEFKTEILLNKTLKMDTKREKPETGRYQNFNLQKYKKKGRWTIVGALDCVLQLAKNSELCDEFRKTAKTPLAYLRKTLGMTDMQIIVLAFLIECGQPESWRSMGNFLNISRLQMMTYSEEIEELLKKGWFLRAASHEDGYLYQGFKLSYGVVTALRKNKVFVPEKLDGLTLQKFMDRMLHYVQNNLHLSLYSNNEEFLEWADFLIEKNQHLEICKILKGIEDFSERLIFLLILCDYARYGGTDEEGLEFYAIDNAIDDDFEVLHIKDCLKEGTLDIFSKGLIEFECNNGIANNEKYHITKKVKNEFLNEYQTRRSKIGKREIEDNLIKKHEEIIEKKLFFNAEEHNQIERLASFLENEKFKDVQKRLEEEGMRKGFACIFYGSPGTGKTETVLQLARQTGRDIMQIEIAGIKDKWVGESEKNIKAIFERYRKVCENTTVKPILFFNEADAIFGTRMETATDAADKMENAMQNIILQEMENLDGILIVTTNLTAVLDKAFERRFLYKLEFKKPVPEIKEKIWLSMFRGKLSDEMAKQLARKYDFSGGEIENIYRKYMVDYILEGSELNFEKLCLNCEQERLKNPCPRKVGFIN